MNPFLLALTMTVLNCGSGIGDAPPELGRVRFGRDVDAALAEAKVQKKPVFLLFQEIPGCATCKDFGAGPLTHPRLVEAIESLFVPVVVHNNKGGDDAKALQRFGEPAWNNPVVRWLDASGRDLIPREDGVWSQSAVALRMTLALSKSGAPVPEWLALTAQELDTAAHARVVLGMHCFWEGQIELGRLAGVVDARPGFLDGLEVVDVRFVPSVVSLAQLLRTADKSKCATHVWVSDSAALEEARTVVSERARLLSSSPRGASSSDDLRRLRSHPLFSKLDLSRATAVRVNALLGGGASDPEAILSPRQRAEYVALEKASAR